MNIVCVFNSTNVSNEELLCLPEVTAESAKLVNAVGVRVSTVAPARSAVPVADSAVAGTRPTVRTAPVPRLTTCRGVWASAAGTVFTNLARGVMIRQCHRHMNGLSCCVMVLLPVR